MTSDLHTEFFKQFFKLFDFEKPTIHLYMKFTNLSKKMKIALQISNFNQNNAPSKGYQNEMNWGNIPIIL